MLFRSMTHELEETQHEISKLQEKVHQISLSQRVKKNEMEVFKKSVESNMDGLKKAMEGKMNCLEANMDGMEANMDDMEAKINEKIKANMEDMKNDLKADMEGLMTRLIQEIIPNGRSIVEETHDEKKINVNLDFINSNFVRKNHHIPNIDMRNFDGKDPVTWILQMEQYFDLNNVKTHKRYALQLYI